MESTPDRVPRKRPLYMDKTHYFVQSLILPNEVLEMVEELVNFREELEMTERDGTLKFFLEKEVQAMVTVTETCFYTAIEELCVYEELRASARVVLEAIMVATGGAEVEGLAYCMPIYRNEIWAQIRDGASRIEAILDPE